MEKVAKEPSFPLTPSVRNFVMYVSIWACFFCLEHLIFKIHSRVYHFQHPCSLDFKIFYIYPLPQWMDTNLPTFPSLQEACFHFDLLSVLPHWISLFIKLSSYLELSLGWAPRIEISGSKDMSTSENIDTYFQFLSKWVVQIYPLWKIYGNSAHVMS